MEPDLAQAIRRIARLILAERHTGNGAERIMAEPADLARFIEYVPPSQLIEELNKAISDLTALELGGQRWALSPCDIALTGPIVHSGTIMALLHLANAPVTDLAEMPEHMRIIGITLIPPYRLFRRPPESPAGISEHRRKMESYIADQKALGDVAELHFRLLTLCRSAFVTPIKVDPKAIILANGQYDQARSYGPDDGLVYAVRAASLLGMVPHLFAGILGI